MDWDKLRIFHAVAEASSFTHAGDKLNLSQSAISRQISTLEHDLGVPLFHRHARGLIMTEQGETLYQTAHDVLLKLDAVQSKLKESTQHPKGPLKVTTTVGLGTSWLTSRIHEFLHLFPDVQLELLLTNEEIDLSMRKADCAIRLRQPQQSDLIQRRLFTVHFHIYASPAYVKRNGQPKNIEDLDNHSIITFGENMPTYLTNINWLSTVGRKANNPRKTVFSVNNLIAMRKVVEAGGGIALFPDYLIEDRSGLMQLMQNVEVPSFDTYFCYPEELKASARLKSFRDFLVSKSRSWSY
ncbi:MAG: LysR family transcriptional regulator [Hyphomicrobiales bacterium]|nr:LysR family transcriptional regulator [Hyphomicrobiales bacterium]